MKKKGYTASVGGVELTDGAAFQKFPEFKQLTELAQGGEDVAIPVVVSKEGANDVTYELVVSYPDPNAADTVADAGDDEPLDTPDKELEAPAVTIARALEMSGWYVLCTAGVDPELYEDIAAYIETQEKMFCYTEMGFFGAGEDGANKPASATSTSAAWVSMGGRARSRLTRTCRRQTGT